MSTPAERYWATKLGAAEWLASPERPPADWLNRRAEVEQALLDVANGKRAPLTPDECRALAMKLGVPGDLQRDSAP